MGMGRVACDTVYTIYTVELLHELKLQYIYILHE
jgi:hypothetical protein